MRSPHFVRDRPDMNDPLSEVIALLQPRAVFSRRISGAGRWGVRYSAFGQPSFCAVLEGSCRLAVDGHRPLTLEAGDFVLLPATPGFTMSGFEPVTPEHFDPKVTSTRAGRSPPRHARRAARRAAARRLVRLRLAGLDTAGIAAAGAGARARRRAALGPGAPRRRGSSERRSGRDLVLTRLVEVLLIEALRSTPGEDAPPGLLRGLADPRVAPAIRQMHGQLARVVDGGPAREDGRAVALGILRALHAHRGPAADGISARLAHGGREGPAAPRRPRRSGRSRSASATARRARSAPPSAATCGLSPSSVRCPRDDEPRRRFGDSIKDDRRTSGRQANP